MKKEDVIKFFDYCAPGWDSGMIKNDEIINTIMDNCRITENKTVLDVACGTGVLFPYYLERNIKKLTAIDISPEMIRIARSKYSDNRIDIVCDDVETASFDNLFDCCLVYNAFPHFPDPDRLIEVLASNLCKGGTLSVAHGMSREQLNRHHSGAASKVSIELLPAEELAEIFKKHFHVTHIISDNKMYQVCGIKK